MNPLLKKANRIRDNIEQVRQYGVRQAMRFLIEVEDQPTMAEEIGRYVLPSRQWRKALWKAS